MEKLTYKQAYDKIIDAYFKDNIKPYNSNFCFCGNIAPEEYSIKGFKNWNNHDGRFNPLKHFYTLSEYAEMEEALFIELNAYGQPRLGATCVMSIHYIREGEENYEDSLFKGMCAALDVLKQIHIERGEVIDEPEIKFTKRNLQPINQ